MSLCSAQMIYVLVSFAILAALDTTDSIEAPYSDDEDAPYTEWMGNARWVFGVIIFSGFICFGFVVKWFGEMNLILFAIP